MTDTRFAPATLTIDLDAIAANWHMLERRVVFGGGTCAAVVKADAYGLGMDRVAPVLSQAGCRDFFVALLDEALQLRTLLPEAEIHVLNGLEPGAEAEYAEYRLLPVLNTLDEIAAWSAFAKQRGKALPADIHVDTGMARLGLPPADAETLADEPECLEGIAVRTLMSHLSCADEPNSPVNAHQLEAFRRLHNRLGGGPASLANSSGIFLGPDYHFDLARPGASLYGVNPAPGSPNPMVQVIRLQGKILQVRKIDTPSTVGYGATFRAQRRSRIATVAVGYGDGYPRCLGNEGFAYLGTTRVPVVGRVSMDLITLDVTDVAENDVRPGTMVDLIGPNNPVDDIAAAANTIGYEILTNLGARYRRVYETGGT